MTRKTLSIYGGSPSKKSHRNPAKPWTVTQIWIESIGKEASRRKQWEHMYGWMADYDAKVLLSFFFF